MSALLAKKIEAFYKEMKSFCSFVDEKQESNIYFRNPNLYKNEALKIIILSELPNQIIDAENLIELYHELLNLDIEVSDQEHLKKILNEIRLRKFLPSAQYMTLSASMIFVHYINTMCEQDFFDEKNASKQFILQVSKSYDECYKEQIGLFDYLTK